MTRWSSSRPTAEVLRVIASSPVDLQTILDTLTASAEQLCGGHHAALLRVEGGSLRLVSGSGRSPGKPRDTSDLDIVMPLDRGSVAGRAVVDRRTIHIRDLALESDRDLPSSRDGYRRFGNRTMLATPLLREGVPIGAISMMQIEVRPFTDQQIALLETFADQAVIAIENARLFEEPPLKRRVFSSSLIG